MGPFQSFPQSLFDLHRVGIQHIHPLCPETDENILPVSGKGRHKILRQQARISLGRNGGLSCGGSIQAVVLAGVIPAAHKIPGTDAVAESQPGAGSRQYPVLIHANQNIAGIGRQPVAKRLIRLADKLVLVPEPWSLHRLPLGISGLAGSAGYTAKPVRQPQVPPGIKTGGSRLVFRHSGGAVQHLP